MHHPYINYISCSLSTDINFSFFFKPCQHRNISKALSGVHIPISTLKLSPGGILDEETVARGLSNLGLSADGIYQVYLDVTIPVRYLY